MRRLTVWVALLLALLVIICGASAPTAQAAPGDFLFQWGSRFFFETPYGVARDQSGNIYVTDFYVANVQVFNTSGKLLRKWGTYGSGNGQFEYPTGIAVAPNGTVYVTDSIHGVQIFNSAGSFVGKFGSAGSGYGEFTNPTGLALDSAGNLYVADTGNDRIQVFDSTGRFLRAWGSSGTGNDQFNRPVGVAVSGGTVYVTDSRNYRIQVFNTAGHFLRGWYIGDYYYYMSTQPMALALDGSGNLYVAMDGTAGGVQVYNSAGTALRKIADGFSTLNGLTVHPNGNVYIATAYRPSIKIFTTSGMVVAEWAPAGSAPGEFDLPEYAAVDSNGNVYVTDMNNHRVQAFTSTGTFLRQWGSEGTGDGQFLSPAGIAIDGAGNVYVSDADADPSRAGNKLQVFDSNGNFLRGWTGALGAPEGMAIDANGYLYVADPGFDQRNIQVYDSAGILIRQWKSAIDPDEAPLDVALDAKGNVYATFHNPYVSPYPSRVEMFDNQGKFIRQIGEGVIPATGRNGITVDPAGNLLVTSGDQNQVFVFDANGTLRAKWGGTGHDNGQFYYPTGITTDKTGTKVYIVDTLNYRVQVLEGYGTQLPSGWLTRDIGSVGVTGSAGFANGVFTIKGAGADIYGSADGFRFVYQTLTGDGQIVARVASLANTNGEAKAGVMFRQSLAANSSHATMAITPSGGAEFLTRASTGGSTSVTRVSGVAAPYWVKVVRSGNTFSAYIATSGGTWRLVGTSTIAMGSTVYVGLPVCSHNTQALTTATMDGVGVTAGHINSPAATITAPAAGATFTAPATIPIGATATPGTGASSIKQVAFYAGSTLIGTATTSPFAVTWRNVAAGSYSLTAVVTDNLGNQGTSAPVAITVTALTPLPSPWLTLDIGSVGVAGSASYANGVFTLKGAGSDISGTADSFRFVYKTMTGNGQITARVSSLQNTNGYAKAGVMIREALTASSKHALMDVTPANGAEFLRRPYAAGGTTSSRIAGIKAPYWVRLVRSGNTFSAYISSNGTTWSHVASSTIAMNSTVYVGFVVSSHNNSVLCTTTIDGVR